LLCCNRCHTLPWGSCGGVSGNLTLFRTKKAASIIGGGLAVFQLYFIVHHVLKFTVSSDNPHVVRHTVVRVVMRVIVDTP